jgi:hypothetical protein
MRPLSPRPLDYLALALSIVLVVGAGLFAYGNGVTASEVSIQSDGGTFLYPLDQPRRVAVPGPLGDTWVRIEDGHARVDDSPCRDKICIAAGVLRLTGEWTACLPNRVFVRVEGADDEDGVDAQTF